VVARAREAFAEQEAYETAGRTSAPPGVCPADVRRDLPFNHATAFDPTPGELSRVCSDQTAYYIYKVHSRWAARHCKAKDEIRSTRQGASTRHQQRPLRASVNASLSQAYFGEPDPARMVPLGKQQ